MTVKQVSPPSLHGSWVKAKHFTLKSTASSAKLHAPISSPHPLSPHRGDAEGPGLLSMQWGGFASQLRSPKFRVLWNLYNKHKQLLPNFCPGKTLVYYTTVNKPALSLMETQLSPKAVHYINLLDKHRVEQRKAVKASALRM